MGKKSGLGSGLDALFGGDYSISSSATEGAVTLPISKVEPRENQPRRRFDEDSLAELTESIRTHGLIQPITVRRLEDGYYQIIAGERRWRAARAAGLDEVPVRILEADDRKAMELALVENLQREDLNPVEEARGYQSLMSDYGLTQEEAGEAVGKSRPTVANLLRLLTLSKPVLDMVARGALSAGHARALIPIEDESMQLRAAELVAEKQLSVRQTESLAARILKEKTEKKPEPLPQDPLAIDYAREVEKELETALGRRVKLTDGKRKGKIEIEFYGAEDRERLIENLRLFSSLRNK